MNKQAAKKERIVVAMSGGVDSSVAALLLVNEGYDVVGISMRLWSYEKEATHGCCTPEDLYDARRVADQIGIPFYVANFERSFETSVIANFVESYQRGETPNPCVRCNQGVKFQTLLKRARELGSNYLATGHYARKVATPEGFKLMRAFDKSRDQSYFLYGMDQAELERVMFPLGDLTKDEARQIAKEAKLLVADKEDSQEICFVENNYADFVAQRLSSGKIRKGEIVNEEGEVLGQHDGIHQFTVGQRKGLGLKENSIRYVLAIQPSGKVVVGPEEGLLKKNFRVRETRWVKDAPHAGEEYQVQIRSRFAPAPARIAEIDPTGIDVQFHEPQRAITPGQAAVLYRGEEVVGGGRVDKVHT